MDLNKIKSRLDNLNQASKPKQTEKKRLYFSLLETKSRRKIPNQVRTFKNKQRQPISRNLHALWSWKIPNSSINKLGRR